MVRIFSIASAAFAAAAVVSGYVVPRTSAPAGWATNELENYDAYHERYLALDCQSQHGTTFFDECCHPLPWNETLAQRPAECNPDNAGSSTASASAPAATSTDDGDDDCSDEPTSAEPTSTAAPASSAAPTTSAAPVTSAAPTSKAAATSSAAPTSSAVPTSSATPKTETPKTSAAPSTSAASTTSEAAPTTSSTPKSTQKATSTTKKATSTSSSSAAASTSTGTWLTGGEATFYDQDGAAGSCGNVNPDTAKIVAVQEQRMNSSLCGKTVLIVNTDNGKTVTATVADTCPSCQGNANSLDLSHGAFDAIADEATGVVPIKYMFLD